MEIGQVYRYAPTCEGQEYKAGDYVVKALVLAGGQGSRVWRLESEGRSIAVPEMTIEWDPDWSYVGDGTCRVLGGIEYAIPGTGNACGAANDCCRKRGHEGDHINAAGRRWGPNGFSQGESWIDLFEQEKHR